MRSIRGRGTHRVALLAAFSAAIVVIGLSAWTSSNAPRSLDGSVLDASGRPESQAPAAVGPLVFYEVLDAAGSRLMERRLDGLSLARVVAQRTDVDYGRTWTVDPTGTVAIALNPGTHDQELEAVSIATGAASWSTRTPTAPVDQAVWSADGRHVALPAIGTEGERRSVLDIEAATGRFRQVIVPDDAIVQGFDPDGVLILRERLPSPQGVNVGWQLLRVDPASSVIERLTSLPEVGPASDWSEDVDPAVGLAVDTSLAANDQGTTVRLWSLRGGTSRPLLTLPSIDRIAIDPGGTGVAISAADTIKFVGFDGRSVDLFSGADPISTFDWSRDGDYLTVATDRRGPNLTVVERSTGRSIELPHPEAIAQLLVVRVVGGLPLPATPLPAVEPTPSPTPGPSGADVAAFGGVLSEWVDRSDGNQTVHVERLVPTEGGGMRVAAAMPTIDLGAVPVPDDGGPSIELLARPGSPEVLVWIGMADHSVGWLWDGGSRIRALALPSDWPDNAYDLAWRPDGGALAASAGRATADGTFQAIFVIAAPGDRKTTVVPIVGEYDRLEGWWSAAELRVGHGICTEGCEGRYAWSARLRIRDRRLVPMTPADRSHAPIDDVSMNGRSIVLSVINGDPADDITIDWPAGLGPLDAVEPIGFAGDGHALLVTHQTDTGTDLYRIADPWTRAVAGHLADPQPLLLAHLEGRDLRVDVSPDDAWAIVHDRVDAIHLVRLGDGRTWPIDPERVLVWSAKP